MSIDKEYNKCYLNEEWDGEAHQKPQDDYRTKEMLPQHIRT